MADDEPGIRELLSAFLERFGYQVHACENGQAAWTWLADPSNHCDAVVADIKMPVLTGTELLRRIREQGLSVPVVLVSGQVTIDADEAAAAGAAGILHKPFRMAELVELLSRIAAAPRGTR